MDKNYGAVAKIKAENTLLAVTALVDHNKDAKEQYESVIKDLEKTLDEFGEPEDYRESSIVSPVEEALKELKEITSKLY